MAHAHVHDHTCGHEVATEGRPRAEAAQLVAAVHDFLRAPSEEREQTMVAALARGSFLAVVTYDPPLPAGQDGRTSVPAGTTMHFRGRVAPDGSMLLAVYSDPAAIRKDIPGHPVETTVLDAERMVHFALHPPHAGAVLNPAGPYLELRAPELRRIVPGAGTAPD